MLKKQVGLNESPLRYNITLNDCSATKDYHVRHAPLQIQKYGSLNVSEGNYRIE